MTILKTNLIVSKSSHFSVFIVSIFCQFYPFWLKHNYYYFFLIDAFASSSVANNLDSLTR